MGRKRVPMRIDCPSLNHSMFIAGSPMGTRWLSRCAGWNSRSSRPASSGIVKRGGRGAFFSYMSSATAPQSPRATCTPRWPARHAESRIRPCLVDERTRSQEIGLRVQFCTCTVDANSSRIVLSSNTKSMHTGDCAVCAHHSLSCLYLCPYRHE